ncbi:MAG: hypothetical protein MUF31_04450 [Akkermansiaceae bacterium]|jgi:hypothetical protein|nr:hypothetical protein [Akkermansiaceae bacterium]
MKMKRRKKPLILFAALGVPVSAALLYFLIPARTQINQPISNVRDALKDLYPKHDFKTVTGNGTCFHGNIREIQEHPAYAGWGDPGWDLDVEYRETETGAFEVEIDNHAKLVARKTIIRAEPLDDGATLIVVRSDKRWFLLNFLGKDPSFARSRLQEIRSFFAKGGPHD